MTDDLERENAELRATIERMTENMAANITNNATWQAATQLERAGFDGAAIAEATTWGALDESTREALRSVIRQAFSAPAVLPAAPAVVTTVEELDALPVGAAILDGGECVAVKGGRDGDTWHYPMGPFEPMLPARILWLPDTDGAGS